MRRQRYTVLRDFRFVNTAGPFRGARPGPTNLLGGGMAMEAVTPLADSSVDVAELNSKELNDLSKDPQVRCIAPVMHMRLIDPVGADAQAAPGVAWGVESVGALTSSFTGAGVTVAVLDTGIDQTHAAFQGLTIVGQDFTGTGKFDDDQGHGTHCAGTIFGRDVNGQRIGVARGVPKALIGKVLDSQGRGSSEMLFDGILWALRQGASVISVSIGFDFPGYVQDLVNIDGLPVNAATSVGLEAYRANIRLFDNVMDTLIKHEPINGGAVFVAAAGNESDRPTYEIAVSIPAVAQGAVSVGAVQRGPGNAVNTNLGIASFSNTFPQVAAPGVDIVSARRGGGLTSKSGTSMATPHVAGVAALWWESRRQMLPPPRANTILAMLLATARKPVFAADVDPMDRGEGLITAP